MIGILINGEFLDIDPKSKITIRIRHNIFAGGDPTVKRGSYVLPFTIPLSDHNKALLRNPHRIDYKGPLLVEDNVTLYLSGNRNYGVPFRTGKLFVTRATPKVADVSLVLESLGDLKDDTFASIDLDLHAEASSEDMRTHALDTITNPLSHNHCFIPVHNPTFIDADNRANPKYGPAIPFQDIQNYFDYENQTFGTTDTDIKNQIVTPFIRVDYLLEKIATHIGYSLENEFQTDDELKLLYVHHVNNLFENGDWPKDIDYNLCLPNVNLNEFLKKICALFFIGIFPNHVTKTLVLRPLRELLKAPHKVDWSLWVDRNYDLKTDTDVPKQYGYAQDREDSYIREYPFYPAELIPDYFDIPLPAHDFLIAQAYHWMVDDRFVRSFYPISYSIGGPNIGLPYWKTEQHYFDRINIDGATGDPYLYDISPLFMYEMYLYCNKKGSGKYHKYNENLEPVTSFGAVVANEYDEDHAFTEQSVSSKSIRLMLYRGMKTGYESAELRPIGSNNAFDLATNDDSYEYSLLWNRANGIYEKWAGNWIEFLKNKKVVTMQVALDMNDLLNMEEFDKVRIDNMNYFILEVQVDVTKEGLQPANVTLVTAP